jgi:uncharacterized repeat protein (TIGR03803 family)
MGQRGMTARTRAVLKTEGTYEVLHHFGVAPEGGHPVAALIRATDGNFYGTTQDPGDGTVFKMTPDGVVTIVHAFTGVTDGKWPRAALIQATDGKLYGTTFVGGGSGDGTVFRMTPDGTSFTVLHAFTFGTDGGNSEAPLIQATDGNFYGTTRYNIFRMAPDGTVMILHAFTGSPDGAGPGATLIQATDGNFYGTTVAGGSAGFGTVFRMTPDGTVTILHSFDPESGGCCAPRTALLQGLDGNLYGTSEDSAPNWTGYLFKVTMDGTFTVVTGLDWRPNSALIQTADGTLYGTELDGRRCANAVFQVILEVGVTVLHTSNPMCNQPLGISALVQHLDGTFYGTTEGGVGNVGTVFRMTPDGTTMVLHTFSPPHDGFSPHASLIQADDGNLYGTTLTTLFRMAADGTLTVLHTFDFAGREGSLPSALVQAADRNFYGTTYSSNFNTGTVFRMTPDGAFTVLHEFVGGADGARPSAAPIQATDGNLYGTTSTGGVSVCGGATCGTVFRVAPDGTGFSVLHRFTGSDGGTPSGALLQATDGNFYGTTSRGGDSDSGTLFRMTPDGTVTVLHQRGSTTGLMQATDGNFYGTSYEGAFRMSPDGTFTLLNALTDYNAFFRSSLIQASDGNFYGTIGPVNGVVFQMTSDGTVTVLHRFVGAPSDGDFSQVALVQANDRNLYGTASGGGVTGSGMIFRIGLP